MTSSLPSMMAPSLSSVEPGFPNLGVPRLSSAELRASSTPKSVIGDLDFSTPNLDLHKYDYLSSMAPTGFKSGSPSLDSNIVAGYNLNKIDFSSLISPRLRGGSPSLESAVRPKYTFLNMEAPKPTFLPGMISSRSNRGSPSLESAIDLPPVGVIPPKIPINFDYSSLNSSLSNRGSPSLDSTINFKMPIVREKILPRYSWDTLVIGSHDEESQLYPKPLKIRDFLNSGMQLHIHENEEGIMTGSKVKNYLGDFTKLSNYQGAMGDYYADQLGFPKITKNIPKKSFIDKCLDFLGI